MLKRSVDLNEKENEMQKIDESVKKMWDEYLTMLNKNDKELEYTSWHFCNDKANANELADLVLSGVKRATTSLYCLYEMEGEELPLVDEHSIITNWDGIAQCIIRTTNVEIVPFNDVSERFANLEGEGDKSLKYWKTVHISAFSKELMNHNLLFSDDMKVVCESFEVVHST